MNSTTEECLHISVVDIKYGRFSIMNKYRYYTDRFSVWTLIYLLGVQGRSTYQVLGWTWELCCVHTWQPTQKQHHTCPGSLTSSLISLKARLGCLKQINFCLLQRYINVIYRLSARARVDHYQVRTKLARASELAALVHDMMQRAQVKVQRSIRRAIHSVVI